MDVMLRARQAPIAKGNSFLIGKGNFSLRLLFVMLVGFFVSEGTLLEAKGILSARAYGFKRQCDCFLTNHAKLACANQKRSRDVVAS